MRVRPTTIASPSSSRFRPCTRRPLTNEPLRDRPSSMSVQAPPTRSSIACARETSLSQSRRTSLSGSRPTSAPSRSPVRRCADGDPHRGRAGTAYPAARPRAARRARAARRSGARAAAPSRRNTKYSTASSSARRIRLLDTCPRVPSACAKWLTRSSSSIQRTSRKPAGARGRRPLAARSYARLELVDAVHAVAVDGGRVRQPLEPPRGGAQVALDVGQPARRRSPRRSPGRRAGRAARATSRARRLQRRRACSGVEPRARPRARRRGSRTTLGDDRVGRSSASAPGDVRRAAARSRPRPTPGRRPRRSARRAPPPRVLEHRARARRAARSTSASAPSLPRRSSTRRQRRRDA